MDFIMAGRKSKPLHHINTRTSMKPMCLHLTWIIATALLICNMLWAWALIPGIHIGVTIPMSLIGLGDCGNVHARIIRAVVYFYSFLTAVFIGFGFLLRRERKSLGKAFLLTSLCCIALTWWIHGHTVYAIDNIHIDTIQVKSFPSSASEKEIVDYCQALTNMGYYTHIQSQSDTSVAVYVSELWRVDAEQLYQSSRALLNRMRLEDNMGKRAEGSTRTQLNADQ